MSLFFFFVTELPFSQWDLECGFLFRFAFHYILNARCRNVNEISNFFNYLLQPFKVPSIGAVDNASLPPTLIPRLIRSETQIAITGKLEGHLMSCQDLLEDDPGRSRRESWSHSVPNDDKCFTAAFSEDNFGCENYLPNANVSASAHLTRTKRPK